MKKPVNQAAIMERLFAFVCIGERIYLEYFAAGREYMLPSAVPERFFKSLGAEIWVWLLFTLVMGRRLLYRENREGGLFVSRRQNGYAWFLVLYVPHLAAGWLMDVQIPVSFGNWSLLPVFLVKVALIFGVCAGLFRLPAEKRKITKGTVSLSLSIIIFMILSAASVILSCAARNVTIINLMEIVLLAYIFFSPLHTEKTTSPKS